MEVTVWGIDLVGVPDDVVAHVVWVAVGLSAEVCVVALVLTESSCLRMLTGAAMTDPRKHRKTTISLKR